MPYDAVAAEYGWKLGWVEISPAVVNHLGKSQQPHCDFTGNPQMALIRISELLEFTQNHGVEVIWEIQIRCIENALTNKHKSVM